MAGEIALYFGWADGGGHYLQGIPGRRLSIDAGDMPGLPWSIGDLDSGLLRNAKAPDDPDGRVRWTCGGAAEFWHAFVWWDRSGDRRGASNSGFYVRGFGPPERVIENRAAAFAFACAAWPMVVARQRFPLVLVEGGA